MKPKSAAHEPWVRHPQRRSCFDKLSTNGKSLTSSVLDPFALSLSKGGYALFLSISKRIPISSVVGSVSGSENRIRELMQLGFSRILFLIGSSVPNSPWPVLERYAGLIRQFR
jgi:hypothetical protein